MLTDDIDEIIWETDHFRALVVPVSSETEGYVAVIERKVLTATTIITYDTVNESVGSSTTTGMNWCETVRLGPYDNYNDARTVARLRKAVYGPDTYHTDGKD